MILLHIKYFDKNRHDDINHSEFESIINNYIEKNIASFNNEYHIYLDNQILEAISFINKDLSSLNYKEKKLPNNISQQITNIFNQFEVNDVITSMIYFYQNDYTGFNSKVGEKCIELFFNKPNTLGENVLKEVFLDAYSTVNEFTVKAIYLPLIANNLYRNKLSFDFINKNVTNIYLYKGLSGYPNIESLNILRQFYEKEYATDLLNLDIHQQMYSGVFSSINQEDSKNKFQINLLVQLLNNFYTCNLIEAYRVDYNYESKLCKISFNEKEYILHRNDVFLEDLNRILIENKIDYRAMFFCHTDIDAVKYINSLVFLNKEQISMLYDKYGDIGFETELLSCDLPLFYNLSNSSISKIEKSPLEWFYSKYLNGVDNVAVYILAFEFLLEKKIGKNINPKWIKDFEILLQDIGVEALFKKINEVMILSKNEKFWQDSLFIDLQKNLVLFGLKYPNINIVSVFFKNIIEIAYTKISGVGPKSAALGNYVMTMIANSGFEPGFGILIQFKNSTKYNRFVVALDKYIDMFIENSSIPSEILADKSIQKYGFDNHGKEYINYPDLGSILLKIEDYQVKTYWQKLDGKITKTIPKDVKSKIDIKYLNSYTKDINKTITQLKSRIRTYWLEERVWTVDLWLQNIYSHPIMREFAKNMIWCTKSGIEFIVNKNYECVDYNNNKLEIMSDDIIYLWHPILADTNSKQIWQKYIVKNEIRQVEKQVFREYYLINESEQIESNRFEGHYLLNDNLMAISNAIGWKYSYVHEGVNHPRKFLKKQNITFHFNIDYDRHNLANYSREVFVSAGRNESENNLFKNSLKQVPLNNIDNRVVSEMFRDIDLLVSKTSIINKPSLEMELPYYNEYYTNYMIGELSKTISVKSRKEILQNLASFFDITLLGFEGNFMLIKGKINEYKINLGSGFIQNRKDNKNIDVRIEPSAQRNNEYRLPIFEDETLEIIIAKAQLLSKDDEIEINYINSQL